MDLFNFSGRVSNNPFCKGVRPRSLLVTGICYTAQHFNSLSSSSSCERIQDRSLLQTRGQTANYAQ